MERGFPPPPLPPPMMTMPNPPSELSPQPLPPATPPPPPPTRGWSSWGQRRLFDEYLFLTQAQQARCYEVAFGRWRRDRGRAAFTMGILYWQLNAIWPGPDWSTIEYDGRLRLSHYSVARAFAPLALSVELDVADDGSALDGRLRVHAASDLPGAVAGTLRVDVHLWATAPAWPAHSLELPVSIAAEASAIVHEVSLVALGLGPGAKIARDDAFVRLSFEPNDASAAPGAVPSTGRVFVDVWLTPFKSARMTRAQPAIVSLAQTSLTRAVLRILSNATAALVAVESDAVVGAFSDGAFTLLAGEVRELTFEARAPFALEQMRQGLSVRSVWDTYEGEEAT
jgi:beta-mannosidase